MEDIVVRVYRNNFYLVNDRYESFHEDSPPTPNKHKSICGCTCAVDERPKGIPDQVQQGIYLESKIDSKYQLSIEMKAEGIHYTLRWQGIADEYNNKTKHAYFWFYKDKNQVKVEIYKDGYDEGLGYVLGNIYFGNRVDTSAMVNGWLPSEVIRLEDFKEDDVWTHDYGYYASPSSGVKEVISKFDLRGETVMWLGYHNFLKSVADEIKPYAEDFQTDVAVIRENVEKLEFVPDLLRIGKWFTYIIDNLEDTQVFKHLDSVKRTARSGI